MKVYSWSKKGWNGQNKEIKTGIRSKIPYEQTEFEQSNATDSMSLLNSISGEVQIGSPLEQIDNLPPALRYVYQSPDEWYISKDGKLFKIIDPITQVYQYGDWGTDKDESDTDVFDESKNTLREYLERSRIIDSISDTDTMFDVMDYLITNDMVDGSGYENKIESIPFAIGNDKIEEVKAAQDQFKKQLNSAKDSKEVEIIKLAFEQTLDNMLNKEMTLNLSSKFTANRYSQPSKRFEFILTEKQSDLTEAKYQREAFFLNLFKEVSDCDSMEALYGPISPIDGKRYFEDGIMHKISNMYQHDKEICTDWSIEPMVNAEGKVIKESSFQELSKRYLKELKEKCFDEETLRRRMNARFLNKQKTIPAVYDENGELVSPTIKIKDSWFHRERAKAMKNLFLTKSQWAGIYQLINLLKKKSKFRIADNDEKEAAMTLKEGLDKCETLKDLGIYRYESEKREFIYKSYGNGIKVNTYRFNPSLVDRLSNVNEQRWWREVIKKHHKIIAKGIQNG